MTDAATLGDFYEAFRAGAPDAGITFDDGLEDGDRVAAGCVTLSTPGVDNVTHPERLRASHGTRAAERYRCPVPVRHTQVPLHRAPRSGGLGP